MENPSNTCLYLVTCNWGRPEASEYWSIGPHGNYSRELAIHWGHSNAHKEYAMRRKVSVLARVNAVERKLRNTTASW